MNHVRLTALALCCVTTVAQAERIIVDQIVARINGSNILQSDLKIPRIINEGNTFSLDEAINDELLYQHAVTMKMLPTTTDVDRQFVAFKVNNGLHELSDEEFEMQLKDSGFTLDTYKQQLGKLMANENVKRAEISEKIIVSSQEVESYYNEHPEYTKEAYHIATTTIAEDDYTTKKATQPDASTQDLFGTDQKLTWEDHGSIETADLNDDYLDVQKLGIGQIMEPLHKENSYELVKLVGKQEVRLKTLAERYNHIERAIQNKRKDKIIKELEQNLRAKATITHLL